MLTWEEAREKARKQYEADSTKAWSAHNLKNKSYAEVRDERIARFNKLKTVK